MLHEAECIGHLAGGEHGERQGVEDSLPEKVQQLAEPTGGHIRAQSHDLVGIDGEVTDVVAKGTKADAVVLVEIPLTEFE